MSILEQIAVKIIREQELVIGPLAWKEASKVDGLDMVDAKRKEVSVSGHNQKETINKLVSRYERLFGPASHGLCKEAVASIVAELPAEDIPSSLQ
jgi:hypothetical protein